MPRTVRPASLALTAASLLMLTGCYGLSQNPSYFPYLRSTGDIVRTHAKPPGLGYYADFDPHAIRVEVRPIEGASPVRKQYVVVATVYDDDNKPRRNRRVEWMLEGAGNIIEVDESGQLPGRGYKVDNKYAVSYTDYFEHRITRGNKEPGDDFVIRPGQSWCVISSAEEGDTHLTVYCPEIFNWDNNKVVVTTHWIDAQWAFPTNTVARAGSEPVLTTSVIRTSDRQPLSGYRVRYRIVDGPPAFFLPGRTQEYVATTDLRGDAPAVLAQASAVAGVNKISIEIVRDPRKGEGVGMVLGRTEIVQEWQAPVVTLDVNAPPSVVVGQELPCTIVLSNTGQVETRSLTVRATVPEGTQYVRSDPPATVDGTQLVWTLRELAGKQTRNLQMVFRTTRVGPASSRVNVVTEEGLRGEKTISADVQAQPAPGLRIGLEAPPTAAVGAEVAFKITVSNPGTAPTGKVVLNAAFSPGLEHQSKLNPVETTVAAVAPGQSTVAMLPLTVKQAGALQVSVSGKADGLQDKREVRLTAQEAKLAISSKGPTLRYAGRPAEWTIQVSNSGEVALPNVTVRDTLPVELAFKSATEGGQRVAANGTDQVVWSLGPMKPGETKTLQLTTICQKLSEKATHVVIATADPNVQAKASSDITIQGLPAVRLRVSDTEDPIEQGGRTTYRIEVTNQGSLADTDVEVSGDVPPEMRVIATKPAGATVKGQSVVFAPIAKLDPGQSVTYTIEVESLKAGPAYFEARVKSKTLQEPLLSQESTIVLPGGKREPAPAPIPPPPMPDGLPPIK
jgi:uncharacterized repeat protein (TIGR01451 family)